MEPLAWCARALPWLLPGALQQWIAEPNPEKGACVCSDARAIVVSDVAPNTHMWESWKYVGGVLNSLVHLCSPSGMLLSQGRASASITHVGQGWRYSNYYSGEYSESLCRGNLHERDMQASKHACGSACIGPCCNTDHQRGHRCH
eukprot:2634894-Amphidinium_carterae.4